MTAFTTDTITRGYEADTTRRVPVHIFYRFLEHQRWTAMCEADSGLPELVDHGHFFVVRRQRLVLERAIGQAVPLRTYMWCEHVGRSSIEVAHEVRRRTDGAVVARAQVNGLWLGPSRRLTRIPNELRAYMASLSAPPEIEPDLVALVGPAQGERLESSYIRPPELLLTPPVLDTLRPPSLEVPEDAHRYELTVRPSDLDIFNHVNAATYLEFCDDARLAATAAGIGAWDAPVDGAAIHYHQETIV
ncbi:MAG: acyl-CoA thioesterase FadM, partial [Bradymonadia bacterium]